MLARGGMQAKTALATWPGLVCNNRGLERLTVCKAWNLMERIGWGCSQGKVVSSSKVVFRFNYPE